MTKHFLVFAVALGLSGIGSIFADDNVREVQTKLRDGGFYSGEIDGAYSSALAAALTRYQVGNGLPVTGQLDTDTSKALGAKPAVTESAQDPEQSSETWRQLRKSRQQSRAKSTAETAASGGDSQNAPDTVSVNSRSAAETTASRNVTPDGPDKISAAKSSTVEKTTSSEATEDRTATTAQSPSPIRSVVKTEGRQVAETQPVDSPPSANTGTTRVSDVPRSFARKGGSALPADTAKIQVLVPGDGSSVANISTEQVRDYIAAFVLAGLDPRGGEVDFFADRVRYYDDGIKDRNAIRKDLQSYNARWPHRTFWLPGEIKIEPQSDNRVRVTFPLRFELHNGEKKSRGQVEKDLLLESTGDDFQIVAVNERKAD